MTKSRKCKIVHSNGLKFTAMRNPLQFPVYCGSKCVIPSGATGVKIAFRQSHLVRNPDGTITTPEFAKNDAVRLNVYKYKRGVYHA